MEIPTNTMLVITPKMNVLQIPIKDEFFVRPTDLAGRARSTTFASEKGFLSPRPGPLQVDTSVPVPVPVVAM